MRLTGEVKDNFIKWYKDYLKRDEDRLISNTDENYFSLLTSAMQWGVYQEYFDSVGIMLSTYHIEVYGGRRVGYRYSWSIEVGVEIFAADETPLGYKTRQEARDAALDEINRKM